ncbi:MAG: Hsp70 family protein [archaeon]
MRVIGIDLGTSKSVASAIINGEPTIIPGNFGTLTPSVVLITSNEEIFVGEMAKRHPEFYNGKTYSTVFSVKRLIGRSESVQWGELNTIPQEISAFILAEIKRQAEEFLGEKVDSAVITVPSSFNENQRRATKDAAAIAGLDVARLLNEPTAAAIAYGFNRDEKDSTIMVIDFGGGTFDVTVMDIGNRVFQVRSTAGDTELGGVDIDEAIVDYIVTEFRISTGVDIRKDSFAMSRIREAAEKAKIELSSVLETQVYLPFITYINSIPQHINMIITRAKLESLIDPIVKKCERSIQQALKDARLTFRQIDKIILVGGCTKIPLVRKFITELSGKIPQGGVDPTESVAIGAAIQAGIIENSLRNVFVVDVISISLGIETFDGGFEKIVERNTNIPVIQSKIFTTSDNPNSIEINVLQGEGKEAKNNTLIGKLQLDGIKPLKKGKEQIEIVFNIDENCILYAKAKNKSNGKEHKIVVESPYRLNEKQINLMNQKIESWLQDLSFYELKDVAFEMQNSINEVLTKKSEVLSWEEIISLRKCAESINLLLKKQIPRYKIKEVLDFAKAEYEKTLKKINFYDLLIKEVSELIIKIEELLPLVSNFSDVEARILEQGRNLLIYYLNHRIDYNLLNQFYHNVRLGYIETKTKLIIGILNEIEEVSKFKSLLDLKIDSLSGLESFFKNLGESPKISLITGLLASEENEYQDLIVNKTLEFVKDNTFLRDYFLLLAVQFVNCKYAVSLNDFVNEYCSDLQAITIVLALTKKQFKSGRESIAKMVAEKFPTYKYFNLVFDLTITESNVKEEYYLVSYLMKHPGYCFQKYFLKLDTQKKQKIIKHREFLLKLACGPIEDISLLGLESLLNSYPDELLEYIREIFIRRDPGFIYLLLEVLFNYGKDGIINEIIKEMLLFSSPKELIIVLEFIEKKNLVAFIPYLYNLFNSTSNIDIKHKIVNILLKLNKKQTLPFLLSMLLIDDDSTKNTVILALQENLKNTQYLYKKLIIIMTRVIKDGKELTLKDQIYMRLCVKKCPETKEVIENFLKKVIRKE